MIVALSLRQTNHGPLPVATGDNLYLALGKVCRPAAARFFAKQVGNWRNKGTMLFEPNAGIAATKEYHHG